MCDNDIIHNNKENTCIVFFHMRLHAVVERRWGEPPFSAVARCVYVHILLFIMANILLVN